MSFTKDKSNHDQKCPMCTIKLDCTEDYIGGGSHYWLLKCPLCDQKYVYDTYRFKLENWNNIKLQKNGIF